MIRNQLALFLACALLILGCDDKDTSSPNDTNTASDSSGDATVADTATPPDTAATDTEGQTDTAVADTTPTQDTADAVTLTPVTESEPNDGTTDTEFNDIPNNAEVSGVIEVDDSDVFKVDATPGQLIYIELDASSTLDGHLAVFDASRGGASAGNDFVKIAVEDGTGLARLRFLAMGAGGYFIAVRDARNTGGGGGAGGADHTYVLSVTERDPAEAVQSALSFPAQITAALAYPGDVHLYDFSGTEGQDILIDMTADAAVDGRLFIFADVTSDWIARNDDRSAGDSNPLIDAFLSESGAMYLVVENIREDASTLGYSISVSLP